MLCYEVSYNPFKSEEICKVINGKLDDTIYWKQLHSSLNGIELNFIKEDEEK